MFYHITYMTLCYICRQQHGLTSSLPYLYTNYNYAVKRPQAISSFTFVCSSIIQEVFSQRGITLKLFKRPPNVPELELLLTIPLYHTRAIQLKDQLLSVQVASISIGKKRSDKEFTSCSMNNQNNLILTMESSWMDVLYYNKKDICHELRFKTRWCTVYDK